ncbi:MAG: hypothetical protein Q9M37_03590 [Desulfonauticus sp.]|nr:hypothetical protein [Desulfonauticus sp.]
MKAKCIFTFYGICLGGLLLLLTGCVRNAPNIFLIKGYSCLHIKKIAVLPFFNQTKNELAGKLVTKVVIAALLKKRFEVEYLGNITGFLIHERIIVRDVIDLNTIKLLRKKFGIDAIVVGRVEECSSFTHSTTHFVPKVALSLRVIDAKTGSILYLARVKRTGDDYITLVDFGKIKSVGSLIVRVVDELLKPL